MNISRIPSTKTLFDILPQGRDGGNEFARIVDLLLFYAARQNGGTINLFSDHSGDWNGLDSYGTLGPRIHGNTGYQYKFFKSPLSSAHRGEIENALQKAADGQPKSRITKWILVTPENLSESSTKKDGGDVTWFENLKNHPLPFEIEHWGHTKLQALFLQTPALCLCYYPELSPNGATQKTNITNIRAAYDNVLSQKIGRIEFVGMSVRKEEASRGVGMADIYIPLATVPEGTEASDQTSIRTNPLDFIERGRRTVILGDPGSGKSTLLRFLALIGKSVTLQRRCNAAPDDRLPILVTLRKYADELKSNFQLPLIDFITQNLKAEFSNPEISLDFLRFYFETGQAILLLDGVDELPDTRFKVTVRERVQALATTYPGNTIIVTSRVVGYEAEARFEGNCPFHHYQIAPLREPEIKQFAQEWHAARVEDSIERVRMVADLMEILSDPENHSIRELSCNPLLLTIIVLVHRIDAVLPDQRVLLYQKCVETLLITWHTWKYRASAPKRPDREDRRNLRRMEAIAEWLHERAGQEGRSQRSIAAYDDLIEMLVKHIVDVEKWTDAKGDPIDEAADFLSFVREKSGLLVEAGPDLYSFVHLTFQEYLAARNIITRSESRGGDDYVWGCLNTRILEPRWNEVARLLIAARESEESQRNLLDNILELATDRPGLAVAAVAGGLLIDRVPAAEERASDILYILLKGIATNPGESLSLIPMLSTLVSRAENSDTTWDAAFQRAWTDTEETNCKLSLFLAACATPLDKVRLPPWLEEIEKDDPLTSAVAAWLIMGQEENIYRHIPHNSWLNLAAVLDRYAHNSPDANVLAAITCGAIPSKYAHITLLIQVSCLLAGYTGPAQDFTKNLISFFLPKGSAFDEAINSQLGRSAWVKFHTLDKKPDSRRGVFRRRTRDLRKILRRSRKNTLQHLCIPPLAGTSKEADKISLPSIYVNDTEFPEKLSHLWGTIEEDREAQRLVLDLISKALNISFDNPLWIESLRVRLFPSLAERFSPFNLDPVSATKIGGFDNHNAIAACLWLMYDVWLYAFEGYAAPEESPLDEFENLWKATDNPTLQLIYWLRKIVHGEKDASRQFASILSAHPTEAKELFNLAFNEYNDM